MGANRYEVKRGLNLVEIPVNAIEGSIGFLMKAWDIAKFGGVALFENWEGLVSGASLNSGTSGPVPWQGVNTNQYHEFGALWRGGVQGASGSSMMIGSYVQLTAGTATTNNASLGAYKPFFINRNATWNCGTANGIVFEALVDLTDTNASVFNAFVGMVNKDNPGTTGATPAYTDKTTNVKRWGFTHYGTTACIFTNSALGSGSYTYFGTRTVTDTSATVHLKSVLTMNPYVVEGTTFYNSIKYYVNDTLVDVVSGSASSFPAGGSTPYYPYMYIEALGAAGVDGRCMKVRGVKVYYF